MDSTAHQTLQLGHSPDPDDAFMHFALAADRLDTGGLQFEHKLEDIESLNRRAVTGDYEITAVSIHGYAFVADKYALLNHGASMGEGYGPRIVAREEMALEKLQKGKGLRLAIPGEWTSAHLAAQMLIGPYDYGLVEFDQIPNAVESGEYDAGVLIHEGQLTFQEQGLVLLEDLGVWWAKETGGLPLPLGGNTVRRDLGDLIPQVSSLLRESIKYGLDNREESVKYSLQFGRDLTLNQADEFIAMYVNERTLDYGDDGREAVRLFLERAHKMGLIPAMPQLDFVR
ncbi:MAG: ABC transporter substrate-binding protein [Planctomycetes bacterium]|nr:ABC transporter substrate-binding protein [Planctomycetota bacterium]MCP4771427.1 ABC transporter substrate-binding protein [Planctomycetota bacterium]MCP4861864.1 ABC transporter substrate-binding protein [Planctomycetota bacterium]